MEQIQTIAFKALSSTKSESRAEISVRNFKIETDEPLQLGGTDMSPNPVEYILAGVAGCLHILGYKVAKEQNITVSDLKIEVVGELNPAKLFGISDDERAGYQGIEINMIPTTDATEEQLTVWKETIVRRSPVLDNLFNNTPLQVKFTK